MGQFACPGQRPQGGPQNQNSVQILSGVGENVSWLAWHKPVLANKVKSRYLSMEMRMYSDFLCCAGRWFKQRSVCGLDVWMWVGVARIIYI